MEENKSLEKTKSNAVIVVEDLRQTFLDHSSQFSSISTKESIEIFAGFLFCCKQNPKILKCNKTSILLALSNCLQFKLYPGARQECALIPRENRKQGTLDLNFQPMVLGIVKHAYDSKFVTYIDSEVFREKDLLEYQQGTDPKLVFKKNLSGERGKIVGAYAVVKLSTNETIIEVMSYDEIEKIRKSAKTQDIWGAHVEEMSRKTVIKRALKRVRKSDELAEVINYDNSLERPDLSIEKREREQALNDALSNVVATGVLNTETEVEVDSEAVNQ